jgi:hypothetical protein
MKKLLFAVALVAAMSAAQVKAVVVTVDYVTGYHEGPGGEFNVSPIIGAGYAPVALYNNTFGSLGFGTFCVDRNIGINVPGQYDAVVDSSGLTTSGNRISLGTAWLYQQFATGALVGYRYNILGDPGRALDAMNVQLAIWYLEGTYGYPDPSVNSFLNKVKNHFGTLAAATADSNGAFGVGALNLYTLGRNPTAVQPMLTLLPDGGSALILLGMALSGMAVIARKFRS